MLKALNILVAIMTALRPAESTLDISSEREQILAQEATMSLGGKLNLTADEEIANEIIMKRKLHEVEAGFLRPEVFNFSHHYFSYKERIEHSQLYQLIKEMPKGAALHVHDVALLGPDYLLKITYEDNLYMNFHGDRIYFVFSDRVPSKNGDWILVSEARNASGNSMKFDMDIRKHFTIVVDDPLQVDTDVNVVWVRFSKVFETIFPMLTYRPVWEQYFYDALAAFKEDGLIYTEVRTTLPCLYELDGTINEDMETARAYKRANDRFVSENQDFIGAKIIYAPLRSVDTVAFETYLKTALKLKEEFGDFVAGFDVVGQEDLGKPLKDFLPLLQSVKGKIDFFFHAGETNWWGTSSDDNLVDAILLGSKRIGHGYALVKHPAVTELVRRKNVAIEVNVISNQVLRLVGDLRNHPLAQFLATDLPVVISSDDPGLWEAPPISHDLYVVIAGVANKHAGLRTLKQLARNSLEYSALSGADKARALAVWERQWTSYVGRVIREDAR